MIEIIKRAAIDAVDSSKPAGIYYGTVAGVSPLTINIDQKLILEAGDVTLTAMVSDFYVTAQIDGVEKEILIKRGLKSGEKVLLLRVQGGQHFIVLDRAGANL